MPHLNDDFLFKMRPTAERPLLGQTVLAVEDSRFAGEALRLLCLKSGARIRRADSLRAAARHLTTYRPSVVIVDPGLPDGCGTRLISQLSQARPRVHVLLAISGDPSMQRAAIEAGADDFMEKPITSLAAFQAAILAHLPSEAQPKGPRRISDEEIQPEDEALNDDLAHVADLLDPQADLSTLMYTLSFTLSLGRACGDQGLVAAAQSVLMAMDRGDQTATPLATLAGLVQQKIAPSRLAV